MTMHTPLDEAALTDAGFDPDDHQFRERGVPCGVCQDITWHCGGNCTHHYRAPAPVRRLRSVA